MESRRWTNASQPQTLQIAVFLLYATAVFGLIFGENRIWFQAAVFELTKSSSALNLGQLLWGLTIIGSAAGGFGIANEQRWGYRIGLTAAIAPLAARLVVLVLNQISPFNADVISLMFDIALVALLLHPQSREYQRIWFK
ncbi:MAG: hypothetical protein M3P85_13175 [Actinomycetota bacterium]|jgi:hypothetical protein|nr:hypothetical protein [Actinomycetota bacterium]PLS75721.1 MAG: hypothetical protein CYG61_05775 [Actinomycetota bacterium]